MTHFAFALGVARRRTDNIGASDSSHSQPLFAAVDRFAISDSGIGKTNPISLGSDKPRFEIGGASRSATERFRTVKLIVGGRIGQGLRSPVSASTATVAGRSKAVARYRDVAIG